MIAERNNGAVKIRRSKYFRNLYDQLLLNKISNLLKINIYSYRRLAGDANDTKIPVRFKNIEKVNWEHIKDSPNCPSMGQKKP